MKRTYTLLTIVATMAVSACANAQDFLATYTPYGGFTDTASLLLVTTAAGGGVYDVTQVIGTVDGVAVNSPVSGYAGADNQLFVPANPQFVDFGGISFTDSLSQSWNLYSDVFYSVPGSYGLMNGDANPVGYPVAWGYPGSEGTLTVTQSVPEPGPIAALGAGVVGLALRRRRR